MDSNFNSKYLDTPFTLGLFSILVLFFLQTFSVLFSGVFGCGCYGPGSCDVNGQLISFQSGCPSTGFCDCCPACNTCPQLLSGCLASKTMNDVYFNNTLPSTFYVGEAINPSVITSVSQQSRAFIKVCVTPDLPNGLSITQSSSSYNFVLSGTPTEPLPPTTFKFVVSGSANYLGTTSVTLSVSNCQRSTSTTGASASTTSASSSSPCVLGHQRCSAHTSFETCINNADGSTTYSANQFCATGTACRVSTIYPDYVECY